MSIALDKHSFVKKLLFSLLVLCAVILIILVTHFTLSYALSENNSDLALQLNRNNSAAFIARSEADLLKIQKNDKVLNKLNHPAYDANKIKDAEIDSDKISKELFRILNNNKNLMQIDPINSKLYRIAARIHIYNKSLTKAKSLMGQASMLSLNEVSAHEFLFRLNLAQNKLVDSVYYADRLFSSAPDLIDNNITQLSYLMHRNESRPALIKTLNENPVWRSWFFFRVIPKSIQYSIKYTRIFYDELYKTAHPPSNTELGYFINSLINSGNFNLAYKTWLDFLPSKNSKISNINNGDFESIPSGLPFDWLISSATNVKARRQSIPGEINNHALKIEISRARVKFPSIYQLLNLSAGNYTIKGKYKGELIGKRGISWVVNCIQGKKFFESDAIIGRFREWRSFEFNVNIPDTNCDGQQLFLKHGAISPSEQLLYGSIFFDDLSATPANPEN